MEVEAAQQSSSAAPAASSPSRDALRDDAVQLMDAVLETMFEDGMRLTELLKMCWQRAREEEAEEAAAADGGGSSAPPTDRSLAATPRDALHEAETLLQAGGEQLERAVEKAMSALATVEELLPPGGAGGGIAGLGGGESGGGGADGGGGVAEQLTEGLAQRLSSGFGLGKLAERARGGAAARRRSSGGGSFASHAAARRLERAQSRSSAATEAFKQERREAKARDAEAKAEAAEAARQAKELAKAEAKAKADVEAAAKVREREEKEAFKAAQEAAAKEAAKAKAEAETAAKAAAKAEAKAEAEAKKEAKAEAKARRASEVEAAKTALREEAEEIARVRAEEEDRQRKDAEEKAAARAAREAKEAAVAAKAAAAAALVAAEKAWLMAWEKGGVRAAEMEGYLTMTADCLVAANDDNDTLVCVGGDGDGGSVSLYSAASGKPTKHFKGEHTDRVVCVAVDGDLIASGSRDKTIRLWSRKGGKCIGKLEGCDNVVCGLALKDGLLLSGEGTLEAPSKIRHHEGKARLWSVADLRQLCLYLEHTGPLWSVALGEDVGLSASHDACVHVWPTSAAEVAPSNGGLVPIGSIATLKHPAAVFSVSVSVPTSLAATGCGDGRVRLWSLVDYTCVRTLDHVARYDPKAPSPVFCVQLAGHTLVSGGQDKIVKVWNLMGEEVNSEPMVTSLEHGANVRGLATSPQGGFIVSAGGRAATSLVVWRPTP